MLLLVLGWGIGIYGGILLLVRAFRTSIVWGLVALFVPLGNLVFICTHWLDGRRPLVAGVVSLVLLALGVCASPNPMKTLAPVLTRLHVAPGAAEASDPAAELDTQINRVRDESGRLEQEVDSETQSLVGIYNGLAKRRAALKAGDHAATAAFNRDAAAYTARKRQLDAMRGQLSLNEGELPELLAKRAALTESIRKAHSITIYGTSWCPACKMAREYLQNKGIAYQDIDVEHDADGAREFQRRGGGGVPMIVINGEQMTGFDQGWVDAHLQ